MKTSKIIICSLLFIFLLYSCNKKVEEKDNYDTLQEFEEAFFADLQKIESAEDIRIIKKYFMNKNEERIFSLISITKNLFISSLVRKGLITEQKDSQYEEPIVILHRLLMDSELKGTWQYIKLEREGYVHDPYMTILYKGEEIKLKIDKVIEKTFDGYWKFK